MADLSVSQAKQATAKSASDVFGPLEADALATLAFWVSHGGRMLDSKGALDAAKFILEKKYGKSPESSTGAEPTWMRIVRKAMTVDGVPLQDIPGVSDSLTGSAEVEEVTFEFNWGEAS